MKIIYAVEVDHNCRNVFDKFAQGGQLRGLGVGTEVECDCGVHYVLTFGLMVGHHTSVHYWEGFSSEVKQILHVWTE